MCEQPPAVETDDLPLPADFTATDDHKKRAMDLGLDIDDVLDDFRLWAEAEGVTARSWNARFTSFMKRRAKFAAEDRAKVVPLNGKPKIDVGVEEWMLR